MFFAGWGMDANPFLPDFPADRDCIVCYDYTVLDFDPDCVRRYDEVLVAAWSMGVWAASLVLPRSGLKYTAALAVNGTMRPIDDDRGIPCDVFDATLAALTPVSLAKFQRRMCASREALAGFMEHSPQRTFESVLAELASIGAAARASAPPMKWDCAVVASSDRIFPPANQLLAWEGGRVLHLRDGHCLSSWKPVLDGTIIA